MLASVVRCCCSYARTPPASRPPSASGPRRTKRDWAAASPFFAAAVALILASISLHKVVTLERVQREGSKKKEYDSVADEWVHQRVTESESDDDSVEALTVRTPLQ